LAQQQEVMVKDNKPLSYMEGTLQPLAKSQAFPGHYQIEFPGEQIENKTNSDVSKIEEIKPLPVPPRDNRPSGFAMPPPPPHQPVPPPPTHVQPFPEAAFRGWMLNQQKQEELIAELHTSNTLVAKQLESYTKMKCANSNCTILEEDVCALRCHVEEEVKKTKL